MSYVSLGINILTGLIYTPWMISSIGRENYGLFTLAMSVITLFVFDFGLSSAVTRYMAKYLAEGRQDKANQCLGLVYRLYLYIDVFFLLLLTSLYFFIPQLYKELTPDEIDKFKVIYIIAGIFTVVSFPFIPVNGILTANEKFVQLKGCEVIHKLIIVSAMTVCLMLGFGLYALVLVNAIAGLITIVLKLFFIRRDTKTKVLLRYHDKDQFREIVGFSVWTTVIAVCQRMIFTIAPTLLGFFSGSVAIAIFGIANTIEGYVFSFSNALSGMFLPSVSRIVANNNGNVLPLMIKVGRIQLFIVGFVVMAFCCVGREFIQLWVGADFSLSYWCTILLILPSVFHLPQEIGMQTIIAQNKVKQQAIVWIIVALFNLFLMALLTWRLGVLGLCLSICLSFFIRTIGMDIILKKELLLQLEVFFRETFLSISLMIFVVASLSFLIYSVIGFDGFLAFLLKASVFVLLFSIGFLLVAKQEEKRLIFQPILTVLNNIKNHAK